MNYKESQKILEEINKAKKVLINLHRGPDPDSFASAFSLYYFLCSLNKDVDVVVNIGSRLSSELSLMEEVKLVRFVDYSKFDFNKYDLFISADSASWQQIVDNPNVPIPDIPIIVIDHHESGEKYGKINLNIPDAVSCSEIIYQLFRSWEYDIDKRVANLLLMGIIVDSGAFAFSNDTEVMKISAELMEMGADKAGIINKFYRTRLFDEVKAWGRYLDMMELDKKYKFVWIAVPFEEHKKLHKITSINSLVASMFSNIVNGTDFGIVMTETEKGKLIISLRSRGNFDVSKLGEMFGGGGHRSNAGGIITDMDFDKAVAIVLKTARKYARENK